MSVRGEVRTAQALGRAIQQARVARGLSQRDLATRLGTSQRWVWELERGKPGLFTERLFDALRETGAHLEIEIPDDASSLTAGD